MTNTSPNSIPPSNNPADYCLHEFRVINNKTLKSDMRYGSIPNSAGYHFYCVHCLHTEFRWVQ